MAKNLAGAVISQMDTSALITLATKSSSVYSLLQKANILAVKSILRNAEGKVWAEVDNTRAEMLKYLENKNAIGEGNEWLHADDVLWKTVKDEAYDECSSYSGCLNNCVAILFMEKEQRR